MIYARQDAPLTAAALARAFSLPAAEKAIFGMVSTGKSAARELAFVFAVAQRKFIRRTNANAKRGPLATNKLHNGRFVQPFAQDIRPHRNKSGRPNEIDPAPARHRLAGHRSLPCRLLSPCSESAAGAAFRVNRWRELAGCSKYFLRRLRTEYVPHPAFPRNALRWHGFLRTGLKSLSGVPDTCGDVRYSRRWDGCGRSCRP